MSKIEIGYFTKLIWQSLVIVVGLSLVVACTSKKDAAHEFYAKGQAHFESGNYEKARLEFLDATQRDPQYADAYFYLGLIAKREGDVALLFENMSTAIRIDHRHIEAKINVAELYVFGQRFGDALELANQIEMQAPDNFHALRIKGASFAGLKKFDQAEEYIQLALQKKPQDASLYGLLSVVAKDQNDVELTLANLNRAIELAEKKTQYLILRAGLHSELNNIAALENDLRMMLVENPGDEQHLFSLAKIFLKDGRTEEADAMVSEFVLANAGNTAAKQFHIELLLLSDKEKANAVLKRYISADGNSTDLLFFAVNLKIKDGETELAEQQLKSVINDFAYEQAARLEAKAILAELLLRQKKDDDAMMLVNENLLADAQHEYSHLVKADYDLRIRDFDSAISSLRTVLRNKPESEKGLVLLGNAYMASGSELLADDSFRQALEINPASVGAAIPVVRKLMATQDLERSDNIIARVLRSKPNDAKLLIFQAQIKLMKQDWPGAEASVARLKTLKGSEAYAELLLGRVMQGREKYAAAITNYRRALEINSDLVPAVQGITVCYLALSKERELLRYLNQYQQQNPDLINGYLASAQVHRSRGRLQQAAEQIDRALRAKTSWTSGYAILARFKSELGDHQGAIDTYKKGIRLNRKDIGLKILLASYYQSHDMREEAAQLYQKIHASHPENLIVVNNYASLLLDSKPGAEGHVQAMRIAERLRMQSDPHYVDTYGWALYKNGRYAEAEKVLRQAAETGSKIPEIQYHFGVALRQLERTEEAKVVFKRALKLDLNSDTKFALEKALASL